MNKFKFMPKMVKEKMEDDDFKRSCKKGLIAGGAVFGAVATLVLVWKHGFNTGVYCCDYHLNGILNPDSNLKESFLKAKDQYVNNMLNK